MQYILLGLLVWLLSTDKTLYWNLNSNGGRKILGSDSRYVMDTNGGVQNKMNQLFDLLVWNMGCCPKKSTSKWVTRWTSFGCSTRRHVFGGLATWKPFLVLCLVACSTSHHPKGDYSVFYSYRWFRGVNGGTCVYLQWHLHDSLLDWVGSGLASWQPSTWQGLTQWPWEIPDHFLKAWGRQQQLWLTMPCKV